MGTTSTAELELLDSAVAAWGALVRALRGASLYAPDHPQVRPFIETFASGIRLCCEWGEPVVFTVTPHSLEIGGTDIARVTQVPPHLLQRLYTDGVRQMRFLSSFVPNSALTLASALAPYTSVHNAPLSSSAEELKWAALDGLTFVIHGTGNLVADPTTRAQTAWRARVLSPRPMPDPEHLPSGTPLAAVWDGRRGRVPWPPPIDEHSVAVLREELATANEVGVPTVRIGRILAYVADGWSADPRLRDVLDTLVYLVDTLLEDGLPDEASRLLQPLARWTEHPSQDPHVGGLKRHVQALLGVLADDSRLSVLIAGVNEGRFTPDQIGAWFAALPASELRHVLRFGAAVPQGPYRDTLLDVAARFATREPRALEALVTRGSPAEALLALDTTELLDDLRAHITMGLRALEREEGALVARGARMLQSIDAPEVRTQMAGLLAHSALELRSIALRYVRRFKAKEGARMLEELATSASFSQRMRGERLLIGLALGASGGERAAEVARNKMGERWKVTDPEKVAPWILCLAMTGAHDADEPLEWLEAQRLPSLNEALTDARNALLMATPGGFG